MNTMSIAKLSQDANVLLDRQVYNLHLMIKERRKNKKSIVNVYILITIKEPEQSI